MEKLRVYLIGRPFTIVTDCSALRSTFSKKHMVSRVARWWLRSLEFSFEIRHRPGTQMCHVEAPSTGESVDALKPFSVHNPDESDETSDEDYEDKLKLHHDQTQTQEAKILEVNAKLGEVKGQLSKTEERIDQVEQVTAQQQERMHIEVQYIRKQYEKVGEEIKEELRKNPSH
ncbi:RNase H-like domain found in reverse transcriptase [Popillia japonica]|uniref:RNase H-like domain found in reverse transcriptase n=1 Tax=Popillia japonica TaxID=7064 RepID=A0AAW1K1X3_POPJA